MHELTHIITHKSHQPFLFTHTHVFKFKNIIFMKLVFSHWITTPQWASPGGSDSKESACNVGDWGSILRLGRSPGEENGYPFQYSCLENSMDREAGQATVHWGLKELGTTEQVTLSLSASPIWTSRSQHNLHTCWRTKLISISEFFNPLIVWKSAEL